MRIDVKTVRLQGAIHGAIELTNADNLIVHSEQSLVAVPWAALQHTPDGIAVALGPKGYGKVVAVNVAVDNAAIVEPQSQRVLVARQGEFQLVDPSGKIEEQRVKVAGLPRGVFAAALDSSGQRVLLVVVNVVQVDFAAYGVAVADLAGGGLVAEKTIASTADLDLLWDDAMGTWVIGDTSKGALWRWDGARPAVRLAGPAGQIQSASFSASGEGVIVSALATNASGASVLITGLAERERVVWAAPAALPGAAVLMARRHPTRPLWACLAQTGTGQQIQLRDAGGRVLAEAAVRPPAHLNNLRWSVFSLSRLWGLGLRALASATVAD